MFNLAIDSKLRGCDMVAIRVEDVAGTGYTAERAALCGSPWREPRNPPPDIGLEVLVLGAKALSQHRLLVSQDKGVEREPHQRAVNQQTRVAEQDPLAQDD